MYSFSWYNYSFYCKLLRVIVRWQVSVILGDLIFVPRVRVPQHLCEDANNCSSSCRASFLSTCSIQSHINTMTASSLASFPAELLTLVLLHARHNDLQARSTSACKTTTDGRLTHEQQQQQQERQDYVDSVLQLSRTASNLYAASVSVIYEVSCGAGLSTRCWGGRRTTTTAQWSHSDGSLELIHVHCVPITRTEYRLYACPGAP